jgi:hypothetical protein
MSLKEKVEEIVGPYDSYPLECDGLTRVAAYLLRMSDVKHNTIVGTVSFDGQEFNPHYWIELETGEVLDYRLRMWFGEKAPHGVFIPEDEGVEYEGFAMEIGATEMMFEILTRLT